MSLALHYDFKSNPTLAATKGKGPTLTLIRATTATYFDAEGIMRTAQSGEARFTGSVRRENLVGNANWEGASIPLTNWSHPASDDGVTAGVSSEGAAIVSYRFQSTTGRDFFRHALTLELNTTYELSFRVEAIDVGTVGLVINLSGMVGLTGDHVASSAVQLAPNDLLGSVGERFATTFTTALDGTGLLDVGAGASSNQTHDITFSGFQIEKVGGKADQSATLYIPVGESESNAARISGANDGLLIEEERENVLLRSGDFGTIWTLSAGAASNLTVDFDTAPDGSTNADRLRIDNVGGTQSNVGVQQVVTVDSGVNCFSVYAKANLSNWIALRTNSFDAGANGLSYFDVGTGVVGTKDANHDTSGIEDVGNDWYRIWVTFDTTGDLAGSCLVYLAEADTDASITRDESTDFVIWGAQTELGEFPTSYIPTAGIAVTRDVDDITTQTDLSWYGDPDGFSIYASASQEVDHATDDWQVFSLNPSSDRFLFYGPFSTARFVTVSSGAGNDVSLVSTIGYVPGTILQFAIGVEEDDAAMYIDGSKEPATSDTDCILPVAANVTSFNISSISAGVSLNGNLQELRFYNTRLTDEQLLEMSQGNFPGGGSGSSGVRRANDASAWFQRRKKWQEEEERKRRLREQE